MVVEQKKIILHTIETGSFTNVTVIADYVRS